MSSIYQVVHFYDVDGGFGDAIGESEVVATFSEKEKAEDFVKRYANPHVYREAYSSLECGELAVNEQIIDVVPSEDKMWWLR